VAWMWKRPIAEKIDAVILNNYTRERMTRKGWRESRHKKGISPTVDAPSTYYNFLFPRVEQITCPRAIKGIFVLGIFREGTAYDQGSGKIISAVFLI
jgi:hypothetical protein